MIDWTSSIVWRRIAGSSASGIPALTSSIWAPASTCAIASAITVSKLPSFISSASCLRPVGLIRSPMITNGRSNPITTSFVADEARCPSRGLLLSAGADEPLEPLVRVVALELRGSSGHLGLEVVAARDGPRGAIPRGTCRCRSARHASRRHRSPPGSGPRAARRPPAGPCPPSPAPGSRARR